MNNATRSAIHWTSSAADFIARIPPFLSQTALRFALGFPFFFSGLTKWDGFGRISEGALFLFADEFKLHLFGGEIAYPFPALMAHFSGTAEIVLPLMLFVGLGTRFAALGLLVMTLIIQLTVPDGWANFHLPWAAMALAIMHLGAGPFSLDALLTRKVR